MFKIHIKSQVGYHEFFAQLTVTFSHDWRSDCTLILADVEMMSDEIRSLFDQWRKLYHQMLNSRPEADLEEVSRRLKDRNPEIVITRPQIEAVWERIDQDNDWSAFNELLAKIRRRSH